jgi:hypothetical protein
VRALPVQTEGRWWSAPECKSACVAEGVCVFCEGVEGAMVSV